MTTNGQAETDLESLLERLTADLGGGRVERRGGGLEYLGAERAYAALEGSRIALRLRSDIAAAALRTPGTAPSTRGEEWIDFEPNVDDQHDLDRLQAWITIAWRAAQPLR